MLLVLTLLSCLFAAAFCQEQDVPFLSYVSRPDILAPALDVRVYEADSISPDYIFLSTWSDDSEGVVQNGPYIYTNEGELVYSGHQSSNPTEKYFNFQTHKFSNGSTITSVFRGMSIKGRGKGHVALFDSSYQLIRTISSPAFATWEYDFHEFLLLNDGRTAVTVSLQPIQADLSLHRINGSLGWVLDSVFHVVDLENDEQVVFEWRASEHVSLDESVLPPTSKRYAGMSYSAAYDFMHINSLDRFANGDWLVSARHTNTVYRISGIDGTVLWRMGGNSSSFNLINFTFSGQHHARILSETPDRLLISLFNNADNGAQQTSNVSSAMVVELDLRLQTARLSKRFFPLDGGLAKNQGSMQTLTGGNTLVSWGLVAEFSEFDKQGTRVLDVAFVDSTTRAYRIGKSKWAGTPPVETMAVYLYARNEESPTHFWMSWNGATEVKEWVIHASPSRELGRIENMGFETHFDGEAFVSRGYVEAIGKDGRILGRSKDVDVFVPPVNMGETCGEAHCMLQVLLSDDPPSEPDTGMSVRRIISGVPGRDLGWFNIAAGFIVGVGMARVRWSTVFGRIGATLPR